MKLYANTTSPFVRVVRMALHEKGLADAVDVTVVDAWADAPEFLDANPAGRVPALVTDDDVRLTEAALIVRFLDGTYPEPALVPAGSDAVGVLAAAGLAFNVFDAAVSVIIGRKSAPEFDSGTVGRKRFRTMRDALTRLDAALPERKQSTLDLAGIAAITALDYAVFRFPDTDWRSIAPKVAALRDANADRVSVRDTVPRI